MADVGFILIYVEDVAASAAFYARILGRPAVESSPTFAMPPAAPEIMLGLWRRGDVAPKAGAPGGGETAFTVESEAAVEETIAGWKALRARIAQAPTRMDFGFTATALDPDGPAAGVRAGMTEIVPARAGGFGPRARDIRALGAKFCPFFGERRRLDEAEGRWPHRPVAVKPLRGCSAALRPLRGDFAVPMRSFCSHDLCACIPLRQVRVVLMRYRLAPRSYSEPAPRSGFVVRVTEDLRQSVVFLGLQKEGPLLIRWGLGFFCGDAKKKVAGRILRPLGMWPSNLNRRS